MKVLAVLQNQWFKDPDRVRATLERHPEARRRMIHFALFAGCRTGQVLKSVFGDRCKDIVWEEASPEIGGHASSVFPADPAHLAAVIDDVKPDAILAFGIVARKGLYGLFPVDRLIVGPHPTARGADVLEGLNAMRDQLTALGQTPALAKNE